MKLKLPAIFSQRDSAWSSKLLGYNTNPVYSIGGYGCLITCFGMYINQNPNWVNDTLKANSGYAPGTGNFIWSKCTVLGLNQTYQSPYYSDPVTFQGITKMKALLDEGKPLVTHIDFDPRDADDDQHWLLVYGYDDNNVFYAADPWTGTLITLDVYGGVARCVYEWRTYDKILPKDTEQDCETILTGVRLERDRNWNWFVSLCDALGVGSNVDVALAEIRKLVGIEDKLIQSEKTVQESQTRIADLETKITNLAIKATELTTANGVLREKVEDGEKKINQQQLQVTLLKEELQSLKDSINDVQTGWQLILKGVKRLFNIG